MLERETNCGNQVAKIAGEWGERKIGGKKKKNCGNQVAENVKKKKERKKRELCQPSCRKLGEKFNSNLGNEVAENEGKKRRFRPKLERKKYCGNWFMAMELQKGEE